MKNKTIAVDLAKNVFEIGVSDRPGHVEKTYRLSRVKFLPFFVNREPATVLMEACGSAHHWGRQIRELGHEVVLISPQYVRPYVPRDKTDRADVKGLLEAYRNGHPPGSNQDPRPTATDSTASNPFDMDANTSHTNQHGAGVVAGIWLRDSCGSS